MLPRTGKLTSYLTLDWTQILSLTMGVSEFMLCIPSYYSGLEAFQVQFCTAHVASVSDCQHIPISKGHVMNLLLLSVYVWRYKAYTVSMQGKHNVT